MGKSDSITITIAVVGFIVISLSLIGIESVCRGQGKYGEGDAIIWDIAANNDVSISQRYPNEYIVSITVDTVCDTMSAIIWDAAAIDSFTSLIKLYKVSHNPVDTIHSDTLSQEFYMDGGEIYTRIKGKYYWVREYICDTVYIFRPTDWTPGENTVCDTTDFGMFINIPMEGNK